MKNENMKSNMESIEELRQQLALLEKEYREKIGDEKLFLENNTGKVISIAPAKKNSRHKGESEAEKNYMNEMVSLRLFKDNSRYKDDLFVSVNGESCLIKRGVWVKVKRKFALVIDQSLIQDQLTGELMDDKSREFARMAVERDM